MSDAFAELNFFFFCLLVCLYSSRGAGDEGGEGRKWGEMEDGLSRGCGCNGNGCSCFWLAREYDDGRLSQVRYRYDRRTHCDGIPVFFLILLTGDDFAVGRLTGG